MCLTTPSNRSTSNWFHVESDYASFHGGNYYADKQIADGYGDNVLRGLRQTMLLCINVVLSRVKVGGVILTALIIGRFRKLKT